MYLAEQSHISGVNHGTFLHIAHEEGLISNTSIHAGIRAPVIRPKGDLRNDLRCGFEIVTARELDHHGISGVIERLKARVAGTKVYISVDIDVIDPAFAPGKSSNQPPVPLILLRIARGGVFSCSDFLSHNTILSHDKPVSSGAAVADNDM
jgi:arginase family enzyme